MTGARAAAAPERAFSALVRRLTGGDESAFVAVYRTLHPGLLRYLTVLVGVDDAEDVGSETWAQVCRDLASFTGDGDGFRGWVTTIARHRALDHLRAKGRRPVVPSPVDELPERVSTEDAAESALSAMSTEAALALIADLPQDQAEAVLLRAVMGLDAKAAAKVLDKRPGAVRMAAHRGLRTLAQRLTPPAVAAPSRPGVTRSAPSALVR